MSFTSTPNNGAASSNPRKNVMAKQVMISNTEKRSRVNGVRLSRMGGLCRYTDYSYFCC